MLFPCLGLIFHRTGTDRDVDHMDITSHRHRGETIGGIGNRLADCKE